MHGKFLRRAAAAAMAAALIGSATPSFRPLQAQAAQSQQAEFSRYSNPLSSISFEYPAKAELGEYLFSNYNRGFVEAGSDKESFRVKWKYKAGNVDLNSALNDHMNFRRDKIIVRLKRDLFRDKRNREILYEIFDTGELRGIIGVMHSAATSRLITFYLLKKGYEILPTFERYVDSFEEMRRVI